MELRNITGTVRQLADEGGRKVTFVASDSTKDRHGTILNQANWNLDNFNANPIIGYQHNVYGDMCNAPNPDDVLGPARAWVENGELMVEVDFEEREINPLADKIFRKVQNGTLRAVSVGFSPIGDGRYGEGDEARGADNETYYFDGQELLEVSVVNIPSNPKALKKQLRTNTANALTYLLKAFDNRYSLTEIDSMTISEIRELLHDPENYNGRNQGNVRVTKKEEAKPTGNTKATGVEGEVISADQVERDKYYRQKTINN